MRTSRSLHLYLFLVSFLGLLSFCLSCPILLSYVLLYLVIFYFIPLLSLRRLFFPRETGRWWMNLDRRGGREELGDIEERKTIINAYYLRKKVYLFNNIYAQAIIPVLREVQQKETWDPVYQSLV